MTSGTDEPQPEVVCGIHLEFEHEPIEGKLTEGATGND